MHKPHASCACCPPKVTAVVVPTKCSAQLPAARSPTRMQQHHIHNMSTHRCVLLHQNLKTLEAVRGRWLPS